MAAAMGGLDAIVFTGGVGEHAPEVRDLTVKGLGFLGVSIDPVSNAEGEPDRLIGAPGSLVRTTVVSSREDIEIARNTRLVLGEVAKTST